MAKIFIFFICRSKVHPKLCVDERFSYFIVIIFESFAKIRVGSWETNRGNRNLWQCPFTQVQL